MADMIPVESDDKELNEAMEEARRKLPEFRRTLEEDFRRMIPVINRALVKAVFQSETT